MFRFSRMRACAAANASCPCVSEFQKYKTQIGAGVGAVVVGVWMLASAKARKSYDQEKQRNERIVVIEETINNQSQSIKRLQQDLKVAQTAVLGQETTLRKLSDSLIALEKSFLTRAEELAKAVDAAGKSVVDTNRRSEHELSSHRTRLAELHASRAETEARLRIFEKQVQQCREVPAPPPALVVPAAVIATQTEEETVVPVVVQPVVVAVVEVAATNDSPSA
ncbi:Hypothetical protein, putative [Bodo saltans]|uniref:Uncharacterized protein n=1 Tax=Bodo saltans TaxID=75058 RepID=A0A0S4JFA4_BODSA|nr:Hypothetical protein, putative [Bodo saltans]|eukprot:CUG87075.1 Hypothetical protein, putative [Bodo saltans]